MAILPVRGKFSEGIIVEIDDDDFDRCMKHKWYIGTNEDKRVYTTLEKKHLLLHRFIMKEYDEKITIDHKDRNIYNNKKENLRPATHFQSAWNRGPNKKCKNKYKGVYPIYGDKWLADIMANGKREEIGRFKSEEIAAKARDKRAIELHGHFAYLNFPDFDYSTWEIPKDDKFKQKSKQRGVSYKSKEDVWIVRVQINNKRTLIGSYKKEEDAIAAYNKAKNEGINSVPKVRRRDGYSNPYPGVIFNKASNKWRAKIRIGGKDKYLGSFDTVEEAINARKTEETLNRERSER